MYQLLLYSALGAFVLGFATVAILRGTLRPMARIVLGLLFAVATVLALLYCGNTFLAIRDNNANPLVETVIAQLRACASQPDRDSVLSALKAAGFSAELSEHPYSSADNTVWLPSWAVAQSASHISVMTDRVRSDTLLTSDRLAVVFLFDPQGHLLTWSYNLYSVSK